MVGSTRVKSPYRILVTSALPYVNNIPHVGNIIGCVLSADVFARYHRSQGNTVLYVCGTDEHGTATQAKALEEGLTPRQICDKYYAIHKEVYDWFGIRFDVFGRTSHESHHRITQDIFLALHANGYVQEREVEQTYCERDKTFLADRFVEGECPHCQYKDARGDQCDSCGKLLDPLELLHPRCKMCGDTPIRKTSNHLFVDLPALQPKLAEWVAKQSVIGEWTHNAITTTNGWLARGLEQRAITRDLTWGVPVPLKGFEDKVFYVWFDAPIGYISITAQKEGVDWREWWQRPDEVRLYQFMAKDNIPFHTILFPATQLGTGDACAGVAVGASGVSRGASGVAGVPWTMLHHIDATEYLQHEDGKFSKSRGVGLFGDDAMLCNLSPDVFRYYLLVNRPESSDTVFSWKDLQEKLNKELLANFGNLVNRTLMFVKTYLDSTVTEAVFDEVSANFSLWLGEEYVQVTDELEHCREKEALRRIMAISTRGNQYFQEQAPWKTRTEDPERCRRAIYLLVNLIKDLAILLEPFLPRTAQDIFWQLGIEQPTWRDLGVPSMAGRRIGEPKPLFSKLDEAGLATIRELLAARAKEKQRGQAGAADEQPAPLPGPLQLRAGKLIDVTPHPDAQKLFVETVDFGDHTRTIVSGLVGHYAPEQLQGKTALFVTNLAPANLRGVTSEGMILAAQGKNADGKPLVEAVFVDAAPGTYVDGVHGAADAATLTIDEFSRHELRVLDLALSCDGEPLTIGGKRVCTTIVSDALVR